MEKMRISDWVRLTENIAEPSSKDLKLIVKAAHSLEIRSYQHELARREISPGSATISLLEKNKRQVKKGNRRRKRHKETKWGCVVQNYLKPLELEGELSQRLLSQRTVFIR